MSDIRTNRYAILVMGVLSLLMFGTIYAWSVFIIPLESEFGWTRSQTSLTFSIAMIGLSFGMLSIGQLAKRFSLRTCFFMSVALVVGGLFLCQFITELWQVYVFYGVLCGFGTGMCYTTWTTNVLAWFGDRVGFASGFLVMGFGMGALVLGSLASALIYSPLGWRLAFVVIGALALVESLIAVNFIRKPPPSVEKLRPKRDDTGAMLSGSQTVREPSFWLFCIWRSFVMGACGAVFAEASVMMTGIGAPVAFATAAVGALGLGNGVGRPIGGIIYDKIGQHMTLIALAALAFVVSVALAVVYWLAIPELFALFLLILGLLYGMYASTNTSYMRTTFGQRHLPMNTGMSAVVLAPFNLVFPIIAALIFEAVGSYEPFFALVPVLALISLVSGILCKRANINLAQRVAAHKAEQTGE